MKNLVRFFRSKGLAAVLLVVLTLAAGMGNTVPQAGRDEEILQAWRASHPTAARLLPLVDGHNVFGSAWFVALLFLLALNTLACSLGMAARLLRPQAGSVSPPAPPPPAEDEVSPADPQRVGELLLARLAARGFRTSLQPLGDGEVIRAEKYPWGDWMGIIFHLSLVVLLALAAVNAMVTWRGFAVLTEGESLRGDAVALHAVRGRRPGPGFRFEMSLAKFNPRHKVPNFMAKPASTLLVGANPDRKEVLLTTALRQGAGQTSIYQGFRYGVTFFFSAETPDGRIPFRISLPAPQVAEQTITEAALPGGRRVIMQPAFTSRVNENTLPLADRFSVRLAPWRATKKGDWLAETPIEVGQVTRVDAQQVRLDEMRYWSSYSIVYSPLTPGIFAAAWIGVSALLLGFFCYRRGLVFRVIPAPAGTYLALQVVSPKSRWLAQREGEAIRRSVLEEAVRDGGHHDS